MRIITISWSTCMVLLLANALLAESTPKSSLIPKWISFRPNISPGKLFINPSRVLKKSQNVTLTAVKSVRSSVLDRIGAKSKPAAFLRKQLAVPKGLYNPSDPLHAYPNNFDLLVHTVFQRLAHYEINNADAVRKTLRAARIIFSVASVVGIVLMIVALAVAIPVGVAFGRRRDDNIGVEDEPEGVASQSEVDWYSIRVAETILQAIESGQLKYEV